MSKCSSSVNKVLHLEAFVTGLLEETAAVTSGSVVLQEELRAPALGILREEIRQRQGKHLDQSVWVVLKADGRQFHLVRAYTPANM